MKTWIYQKIYSSITETSKQTKRQSCSHSESTVSWQIGETCNICPWLSICISAMLALLRYHLKMCSLQFSGNERKRKMEFQSFSLLDVESNSFSIVMLNDFKMIVLNDDMNTEFIKTTVTTIRLNIYLF